MTTMINLGQGSSAELSTTDRLLQHSVPPRLVRRTHASDVFVTNLRVTGADTFEVDARLPVTHPFYGPVRPGQHDPLLLLETVRESILLVGHVAYEIPREFKWVTHTTRFHFEPAGLATDGAAPVELTLALSNHDIRRSGRRPAAMRTEVECRRDGERIGTATYEWSLVSPAAYRRLRGEHATAEPAAPTDVEVVRPTRVGRTDEVDVVLAERPAAPGWLVRVDPKHPVIYDHTVDHVPGNAVAEVARQAALLTTGRPGALPVAGDVSFSHYLEFDTPCVVDAELIGERADRRTGVWFTVAQDDHRSVEGVFELS